MGPKHSEEEILAAAVAVAVDDGLSRLSFGRVAKRLGIPDRTVVYYFATKDELITAVVMSLGVRLQATLAAAFAAPAPDHLELLRRAWPVVAHPDADPTFAVFFEANGLAAAGHQPYVALVPELVEAWIAWMVELFEGPPEERRVEAEAAVAVIDGLLLVRALVGPDIAERAARRLGIAGDDRAT